MKKHLFSVALGALALTACTSTDVIDEGIQTNAIGFTNVVNKSSRADGDTPRDGDITTATLDKFYVFGYYTSSTGTAVQVFDETEIRKIGNEWTYDNIRYWVPNAKYYFYAYSCADVKLNHTYGTPSLDLVNDPSMKLRFANYICDRHHNHDLIYAQNEGIVGKAPLKAEDGATSAYANEQVKFSFKHILTKINAVFSSDFDDSYDVVVSNVKVINIRNTGNYDPAATDKYMWDGVDRVTSHFPKGTIEEVPEVRLNVDAANNTAVKGVKTVTTKAAYVIPYNYSNGDVQLTFKIDVFDQASKELVMTRTLTGSWSPNWKLGYTYTYNINITGTAANLEEIRFGDMNVADWDDGSKDPDTDTSVKINFSVN